MPYQLDKDPRRTKIRDRAAQDQSTVATTLTRMRQLRQQIGYTILRASGQEMGSEQLADIEDIYRTNAVLTGILTQYRALIGDNTKTELDYVPVNAQELYDAPMALPSFWTVTPWDSSGAAAAAQAYAIQRANHTGTQLSSTISDFTDAVYLLINGTGVEWASVINKPSFFNGDYSTLTNKPTLFSGSYADLSNKPTIPAAQIQADWNQANSSTLDFIKNKPALFDGAYSSLTGKPTLFVTADARNAISLTTTGTTGAASYNATTGVLNVPQYQNSGGTVTSVSGVLPITSTGGNAPSIGINAASGSAAGSMSAADFTKLSSGGVNKLIGTVTITESGITVALGVRRITVALTGAVTTGNYSAFAVSALTAGYSIQDCICTTNGQITVGMLVPALVVGSYSFSLRIVQIQTS